VARLIWVASAGAHGGVRASDYAAIGAEDLAVDPAALWSVEEGGHLGDVIRLTKALERFMAAMARTWPSVLPCRKVASRPARARRR